MLGFVCALGALSCGGSGWQPETANGQAVKGVLSPAARETVDAFIAADPGMGRFFDSAWGFVIFPNVGKGGAGIGGAFGKGEAYEQGRYVGRTRLSQVTVGFQFGGQAYSEILFFEDDKAMKDFKGGHFELGAQASAIAVTAGASADASYDRGVAVFTLGKGGLMVEATVGGQKFAYEPLESR